MCYDAQSNTTFTIPHSTIPVPISNISSSPTSSSKSLVNSNKMSASLSSPTIPSSHNPTLPKLSSIINKDSNQSKQIIKPFADQSHTNQFPIQTNQSSSSKNPSLSNSIKPCEKSKPSLPQRRSGCEGCDSPHDGSYGSGRFCSVHCARRVAASCKWEKQRNQQKRQASLTKTVTTSFDNSSSTLSSASSREGTTNNQISNKRRRVMMMNFPPTAPTPQQIHTTHPVHSQPMYPTHPIQQVHISTSASPPHTQLHPQSNESKLVHPQPQSYQSNQHPFLLSTYSSTAPTGSAVTTPLARTPNPTPPPMSTYLDYSHVSSPTVSPFSYSQPSSYYSYPPTAQINPSTMPQHISREPTQAYPHVLPYASSSQQYSVYPSTNPSQPTIAAVTQPQTVCYQMPPPPPPPTPAPDTLQRQNGQIAIQPNQMVSYYPNHRIASNVAGMPGIPGTAPQAMVSTKQECEAVAEALLCLRSNK